MEDEKVIEVIVPVGSRRYSGGPIVISGPPGAGKSSVGKKIAKKMDLPFYDIDELITMRVGMETTREIIEKLGRPYLWEVETDCVRETFLKERGTYVFAFGGTICNPANPNMETNQRLTKRHAFNICLIPSPDLSETVRILWPRHHDGKQPTVESSNQLRSYLETRIPELRKCADRIIYTYQASIEGVADSILTALTQE